MTGRDIEELRFPFKRFKKRAIRARHEGLSAKLIKDAKERGAATCIEMRGDFIEQENRSHTGKLCRQSGMGKHETDQKRLLFARGTERGWHGFGSVLDDQIGTMRAFKRAACRPVSRAAIAQGTAKVFFEIKRRAKPQIELRLRTYFVRNLPEEPATAFL